MRKTIAVVCWVVIAPLACGDGAGDVGVTDTNTTADTVAAADTAAADTTTAVDTEPSTQLPSGAIALGADEQREGDPAIGYDRVVNAGYIQCGLPLWLFKLAMGEAPDALKLPGRTGENANLSYMFTATTTPSGVDVVGPNCLSCHAGMINGKLVVGLGAAHMDFTIDAGTLAGAAGGLLNDPLELAEWEKWNSRVQATAPYIRPLVVGVNPADNLAAALFAHRDPETLAWSEEPLLELPPTYVVPVDVPPWWRMAKKSTMFYTGAGRGDHARIMMTASALCTDTVEEAEKIDAYFPHVRAYIESIEPPAYPFEIDAELAVAGREVFETTCSGCHGTYGETSTYPNLVLGVDEVGTDPMLAQGAAQFADEYIDWFNSSYYGKTARLEPEAAYYAPPLDGIWATAPFLHNGSVPTIGALLDSAGRPTYWKRTFNSSDYDKSQLGWNFTALEAGHDAEPSADKRKWIYDTTQLGYGNQGHTFGDGLSAEERAAVIEYLKTL